MESGADDAALRQWKRWKAWNQGKLRKNSESKQIAEEPELLIGNWESLLDHLCEGSFELVDQLFTQLEKGRTTSPSHKYLAFLSRSLEMPLVLTTNFDRFIEQAFQSEKIDFRSFDVHRDAELPSSEIVKRQLSVIKLHGSAYGLRLGERLRYPFDANSKQQILQILPRNTLMFVIGFSGYERRMLQLLRTVAEQSVGDKVQMIWFSLRDLEGWPRMLVNEFPEAIRFCKIADAGEFLKELTFKLNNCYPPTKVAYRAFSDISCPILQASDSMPLNDSYPQVALHSDDKITVKLKSQVELSKRPVHVFYPATLQSDLDAQKSSPSTEYASLAAARFVKKLGFQYRPVWINLENHHTVSGIISAFFEKVRQYDPFCPQPPLNLSSGSEDKSATLHQKQKVVARFMDVFQSGKYVLIFDLIDCFGRPQTVHHGMPTYEVFSPVHRDWLISKLKVRIEYFRDFLELLVSQAKSRHTSRENEVPFGESYICITIGGPPNLRVSQREPKTECCNEVRSLLKSLISLTDEDSHVCLHVVPGYEEPKSEFSHWLCDQNPGALALRSASRHDDVRSLVRYFSGTEGGDDKQDSQLVMAFFGMLSCLRRSRPIPVINSIVTRWVQGIDPQSESKQHRQIQNRIATLTQRLVSRDCPVLTDGRRLGELHDGGSLWLYREVRDAAYGSLSENLMITKWVDILRTQQVHQEHVEATVLDSILAVTWHWSIARTFYADVFRPTQDITAIYEYMYHRISAIRIMTLIKFLCEKFPQWLPESRDKLADEFGLFSPLGKLSDALEFGKKIQLLRAEGLATLYQALIRNRSFMRSNASPETLRSWCSQFNDRDIFDLSGEVFDAKFEEANLEVVLARLIDGTDEDRFLAMISEFFQRLHCDAEIADLDFATSKEIAVKTIQRVSKLLEHSERQNDQLKHFLFAAHHDSFSVDVENGLTSVSEIVIHRSSYQTTQHEQHRAFLELIAVASQSKFPLWEILTIRRNRQYGFVEWDEPSESQTLLSAVDHAIEYEKSLRATATTRDEDRRHRTSALLLRGRSLYLDNHFSEGHHWIDLAQAALAENTQEQRLSAVRTHMLRAELLVYSANWHRFIKPFHRSLQWRLNDSSEIDGMGNEDRVDHSLQKLRRAQKELSIAEDLLRESPHYPVWKINVDLGFAVCITEQLLHQLDSVRYDNMPNSFARSNGELEQIVNFALQHLRNAIDTLPVGMNDDNGFCTRTEKFAYQVWKQLYTIFLLASARLRVLEDPRQGPSKLSAMSVVARASALADQDIARWKQWSKSMRLSSLSETVVGFNVPECISEQVQRADDDIWTPSLSAAGLYLMVEGSRNFGNEFWKQRRSLDGTKSVG